MDLKLLKMRCKDSKQHHVMFHELYSVSLRLCIAQNVRFEIPYKVLYFETPFLIIFKCYAWVSCDFLGGKEAVEIEILIAFSPLFAILTTHFEQFEVHLLNCVSTCIIH